MRHPSPMAKVLDQLLRNLGIERRVKEHMAITLWQEAVGAQIAAVATPMRVRDGILFVRVGSSVWRNELLFHKGMIIAKLNRLIGKSVVEDIRFQ